MVLLGDLLIGLGDLFVAAVLYNCFIFISFLALYLVRFVRKTAIFF